MQPNIQEAITPKVRKKVENDPLGKFFFSFKELKDTLTGKKIVWGFKNFRINNRIFDTSYV